MRLEDDLLFKPDVMGLLEQLPTMVTVTDLDGVVLYANSFALVHRFAGTAKQVLGRNVREFVAPEEMDAFDEEIRRVAATQVDLSPAATLAQMQMDMTNPRTWTMVRLDGSRLQVEGRARKIKPDGSYVLISTYHASLAALVEQNMRDMEMADVQSHALFDDQVELRRALDVLVGQMVTVQSQFEEMWAEVSRHADIIGNIGAVAKQIHQPDAG